MATGLSFVTYPISGSNYEVPFEYLRKEDVYVYRDGVLLTQGTDWSWVDDSNITLVDTSGSFLEVRRKTSWAARLVNYNIPSSLNEGDLNLDSKQAFFIGQEATDIETRVITREASGDFDMESHKIINVADGAAASDAVNKGQLDAVVVAAGNVPSPGASIGAFLKATAANAWAWVQITFADITGINPVSKGGTGAATAADARANLGLGTAATQNVGTAANNVVQLDGSAKLPSVDGSALTNLNIPSPTGSNIALWSWYT